MAMVGLDLIVLFCMTSVSIVGLSITALANCNIPVYKFVDRSTMCRPANLAYFLRIFADVLRISLVVDKFSPNFIIFTGKNTGILRS